MSAMAFYWKVQAKLRENEGGMKTNATKAPL
jgi:hypothetical protein